MNFDMADHVLDLFLSQARSRHSTRRSIQILSLKVIGLRVSLKIFGCLKNYLPVSLSK